MIFAHLEPSWKGQTHEQQQQQNRMLLYDQRILEMW